MCFPWAGYRAHQTGLQAENTGELARLTLGSSRIWLQREFTGYREICCSHHPSADSRLTGYRVYRLQREFSGYREICCSHHPSADSRLTGYRVYRLQREFTGYREICCSHHPSADSRLTGYRVYRLPVTEISAAPTIPVLTADSPVTEKSVVPMGRRQLKSTSPLRTTGSPVTEICQ